jgi:hypothetical protein
MPFLHVAIVLCENSSFLYYFDIPFITCNQYFFVRPFLLHENVLYISDSFVISVFIFRRTDNVAGS